MDSATNVFKLRTTTSPADGVDLDITESAGKLHLGELSASVKVEATTVSASLLEVSTAAAVSGALSVSGSVTLGSGNTAGSGGTLSQPVIVQNPFRIPVFTIDGSGGYPQVPADYTANSGSYVGHMFYLSGNGGGEGSLFEQANKWYFNEGGEWFASPFFAQ